MNLIRKISIGRDYKDSAMALCRWARGIWWAQDLRHFRRRRQIQNLYIQKQRGLTMEGL